MKIGLYFGSFNPIHIGHLTIAQYMLNEAQLDKVLFVVSPQNPLKENKDLLPAELRLKMVELSIANNAQFGAENIEFTMPKPSFTIDTLNALKLKYKNDELNIIMGSDSLTQIHHWKAFEEILNYNILVYNRGNDFINPYPQKDNIKVFENNILNISATQIREMLKQKKSIQYMVRDEILPLLVVE